MSIPLSYLLKCTQPTSRSYSKLKQKRSHTKSYRRRNRQPEGTRCHGSNNHQPHRRYTQKGHHQSIAVPQREERFKWNIFKGQMSYCDTITSERSINNTRHILTNYQSYLQSSYSSSLLNLGLRRQRSFPKLSSPWRHICLCWSRSRIISHVCRSIPTSETKSQQ